MATSDWYLWTGIYKKEFIVNNKIMFSETPGAAFQDIGFLHKTYVKARRAFYINKSFYYYCIDRVDSSSNIGKGIDFSYYEYQRLFEMDWSQDEETAIYCRMACFFSGCINGITEEDLKKTNVVTEFDWFLEKMEYAIEKNIINESNLYKSIWNAIYPLPSNIKDAYEKKLRKNDELALSIGNSNDVNVYIFGCGTFGYYAYQWLEYHKYKIRGYFDNNKELWGTKLNDIPVLPLVSLKEISSRDVIVIANEKYSDEIFKQLLSLGVSADNIARFK